MGFWISFPGWPTPKVRGMSPTPVTSAVIQIGLSGSIES